MAYPGFQKSKRSWQEIAAEAFVEKDPEVATAGRGTRRGSVRERQGARGKVRLKRLFCTLESL